MLTSFKQFFEYLLEAKTWDNYKNVKEFSNATSLDGVSMDDNLGNMIIGIDPTDGKNYRNWLFKHFKNTNYNDFLQNTDELTELLSIHNSAKDKFPKDYEKKDINKVDAKSLDDLKSVVKYIQDNQLDMSNKSRRKMIAQKFNDRIELYQDDNWAIVIPLTHEQSVFWAKGANWCTARVGNSDHYKSYSSRGPLYIFSCKTQPKLSHQLHLGDGGSCEFKNYSNSEEQIDKFLIKHPEFSDALIDFWNSGDPVLKGSLGGFTKAFLNNKSNRSSGWNYLVNLILNTDVFDNLNDKDIELLLGNAIEGLNINMVKRYFSKNPKKLSNKFQGKDIILTCIGKDPCPSGEFDSKTIEMCKYLLDLGEKNGIQMLSDEEYANAIGLCLANKKYKTALFLSALAGYKLDSLDDSQSKLKFYIVAILAKGGLEYEDLYSLISNMSDKGFNFYGSLSNSPSKTLTTFTYTIQTIIQRDITDPNVFNSLDKMFENLDDVCSTISEIEKTVSDLKSSKGIMKIINKYKKLSGC